jgi:RHS repeat-associated protein
MQGAGGVGGLLSIHRGPGTDVNGDRTWTYTFHPTYDGNGNVSEYLDENGAEAAHFEYDPFGRLAASTGTPAAFTYRFSTKPQDFETGLYYYGYRYYDPVTGRWPSRDPIEERGGLNLYGFVSNRPIDQTDYKGLAVNWHHELVRKWQEAFKAAGLNIHSPEYGYVLEVPDHIELHRRGYVGEWDDFWSVKGNPKDVPVEDILKHLEKLRNDPKYADLLSKGRRPLVPWESGWTRKEIELFESVDSGQVRKALDGVAGNVIGIAKISVRGGAKFVGKGLKLVIPVAAYLTWCDAKAAGMQNGEAIAFVSIEMFSPIPIEPEKVIESSGVSAPHPAPWDIIRELMDL